MTRQQLPRESTRLVCPDSRRQAQTGGALAPEFARGHALNAQKTSVEIGDIVKAYLRADVGDLPIRFQQQLTGPADARPVHKIGKGIALRSAEEARETAVVDAGFVGQFRGSQGLSEVILNAA